MKKMILVATMMLANACAYGAGPVPTVDPAPQAGQVVARAADVIVEADETFFQPVQEAATEWSAATGMSFLVVSVPAGSEWHDGTWRVESEAVAPHLAGTGWRAENPEPLTAHIGIDPAIVAGFGFTEDELRRAMLHEFGHALGLRFAGGDLHYEGPLPSVMYSGLRDGPNCSLHLGTPELDAWDVASPAFPRTAR